jgi:hypothetical protein
MSLRESGSKNGDIFIKISRWSHFQSMTNSELASSRGPNFSLGLFWPAKLPTGDFSIGGKCNILQISYIENWGWVSLIRS